MLEIQKIRKDINWLIEQIKCLMKKSDADCPLVATEWSPNHSVATGNPYILGCFVWLNGHVYESLIDDNTYPPTNDCYWTDLGEGHLLLEEQSNWNATTGRAFIRNKPTNTSDFVNDGEDGSSPFATLNDLSAAIPLAQDLESVLTEGDTAADKQVNVESVGLWDNFSVPFGFARIYADKSRIWFQSKLGVIMASIRANGIAFKTSIYEYNINIPNATGNRTATFQDASGVIAYISDIPTATPADLVATMWNPNHTFALGNQYLPGTRVFYSGNIYQALFTNDAIVPTNATYWLNLGPGYLLDQSTVGITGSYNDLLDQPVIPAAQVNSDWNATSGLAEILNKPTIPAVITKTSELINDGDNGTSHFISLEDLPSNLTLYATSVASGIGTYTKLVTSITDINYNTVAVNIPTGSLVSTTVPTYCGGIISSANIIVGNPGIFTMSTIGNIRRTAGTAAGVFFYEVYKRTSAGVETLIVTSANTVPVSASVYTEFNTAALFNNGVFTATDRIVIKLYGLRLSGGSNPSFEFQFGGSIPVRTTLPVPLTVVPAINLGQLLDVSVVGMTQGEVLTWNNVGLWYNESISNILGYTAADDATFLYNKFMTNHFSYMLPGENSTYSLLRTNTTAGYLTAGTVATLSQLPMGISYTTGIATSSIAAVFGQPMRIQLSSAQDFTFQRKWKVQITSTVQRYFVGITNKYITATPVNADQTLFLNVLGVVKLSTSDNWFFIYNDGTGVATLIDCGVLYPATNAYTYSLKIQKVKGATSLTITLTRIDSTGNTISVSQVVNSTDYNTGVDYNPAIWVSNNTAPSGSQFYDYGCMLLKSTI